jgi:hypothetical protein
METEAHRNPYVAGGTSPPAPSTNGRPSEPVWLAVEASTARLVIVIDPLAVARNNGRPRKGQISRDHLIETLYQRLDEAQAELLGDLEDDHPVPHRVPLRTDPNGKVIEWEDTRPTALAPPNAAADAATTRLRDRYYLWGAESFRALGVDVAKQLLRDLDEQAERLAEYIEDLETDENPGGFLPEPEEGAP